MYTQKFVFPANFYLKTKKRYQRHLTRYRNVAATWEERSRNLATEAGRGNRAR